MYLDKEQMFSEEQAITVTAASTNVLDLGKDKGAGKPLHIHASVDELFEAAGAATLVVALESDDAEGFGTKVVHWQSDAIPKAILVAGYELNLPALQAFHGRYIRLYFTVATGPMTAGKLTAGLVETKQTNKGNF